jgi:hypothetical protein
VHTCVNHNKVKPTVFDSLRCFVHGEQDTLTVLQCRASQCREELIQLNQALLSLGPQCSDTEQLPCSDAKSSGDE